MAFYILSLSQNLIWNTATETETLPFDESWIAASLPQINKGGERKREVSSTNHFQLLAALRYKKYNKAAGKKSLNAIFILSSFPTNRALILFRLAICLG